MTRSFPNEANDQNNKHTQQTQTTLHPMKTLILLTATLLSMVPLPSAAAPAAVANTATSRRTEFDPAVHGFAFVNTFETTPFSAPGLSEIRFGGLCGGMSYAALDHFLASRPAHSQRGQVDRTWIQLGRSQKQ
jgi:hypothetical protein